MARSTLLWIILIVASGALLFYLLFQTGDEVGFNNSPTPVPDETASPGISPTPTPTPLPKPSVVPVLGNPAACQLSGRIVFLSETLYETQGAKIIYQNVDDVIRHIFWRASPDDGALTLGPNLFEDLDIPNGEIAVGAALGETPQATDYILSAEVSYGVITPSGNTETRRAQCSGSVGVEMQYLK